MSTDIDADGIALPTDMGSMLRERREAMGVSLAEVEAATRIRQKYLSALESNDWHLLPGEIVGRGFLRNYAAYLNLDPEEILERRRAVLEPRAAAALSQTSAGAPLPPERQVDYRPKEVDLKDEEEDEQQPVIRRGPILTTLLVTLLLILAWQSADAIGALASRVANSTQDRLAAMFQPPPPPPTPDVSMAITAAEPAAGQNNTTQSTPVTGNANVAGQSDPSSAGGIAAVPTPTDTPGSMTVGQMMTQQALAPPAPEQPVSTTPPESVAAQPTPVPEQPTPVPPTPVPPTPVPPTPTPEPPTPAPVVQAPVCPDSRAVLVSPGEGQVVSGLVDVTGTATHEAFQYYKLEYAPGANANGGFVYFDGANNPVTGGRLGALNTPSLPNGAYTIRLSVVDQTGNFPPPCQVTVTIQN